MTPEEEARQEIDRLLQSAGWCIQDHQDLNLGARLGVAVREFPLISGRADYILFVDRIAVGAIEAKHVGTVLTDVEGQTEKYLRAIPENIPHVNDPLPFEFESTGTETHFADLRDPNWRSRRIFAFFRPETLCDWIKENNTLRDRLRKMPLLAKACLRDCQFESIANLERSFAENRPRALIQMATGSGKTFAAVNFVYRLIKHAKARRILFLVDRKTLGEQALNEFRQFSTPDDGRKFTELYSIQHMTSNTLDRSCMVCISTIQRMYSMLKGEEIDEELDDQSSFEYEPVDAEPLEIEYNPDIPIEFFDFIIIDECHRSIYKLWRQVLEYFDAFLIGMTATPLKQTLGFFNQNLVMEYTHERAVADGVNVDGDIYRIRTEITDSGSIIEAGFPVERRDRLTRKRRWERLDEVIQYTKNQLDRDVVSPDQIRTIIKIFRDRLFTEIFPGRTVVPKTLVFAKTDSHAEDIVNIIREEFEKGNEFCRKITYKTNDDRPDRILASFRNDHFPRIAVTVDMISTGTDVKPLECLLFMRDVKSLGYFEQMKGRGTRVISSTDFQGVTPDALAKTHFVLVDAVGVTESCKSDGPPLERKRSESFESILLSVAKGIRDEDTLSTLAGRLAKLDRKIEEKDRAELKASAGGRPLRQVINDLVDAIDPDKQEERAKELFKVEKPTEKQIKEATNDIAKKACLPFDEPKFRNALMEIKRKSEQIIDNDSKDQVIFAGYDSQALERARGTVESFKRFLLENRDEITALQTIYSKPYGKRHLTYEQIKQLAEAIERPPYAISQNQLWQAYEQLDRSRVKGAGPQKLLTNIVSLVRFALGESQVLSPFPDTVEERFDFWLSQQESSGRIFNAEQIEWLRMIKEHIATSLRIGVDDFDYAPFHERGGIMRAHNLFGQDLGRIMNELNEALAG